jgi:putative FmdB family regulatory protein
MPIYEYTCDKCTEIFEELVFGDKVPPCPKCGSSKTTKRMSRPGSFSSHSDSASSGGAEYGSSCGSGCGGCSGGHCASCGH